MFKFAKWTTALWEVLQALEINGTNRDRLHEEANC
jgi:hypothetical protein